MEGGILGGSGGLSKYVNHPHMSHILIPLIPIINPLIIVALTLQVGAMRGRRALTFPVFSICRVSGAVPEPQKYVE